MHREHEAPFDLEFTPKKELESYALQCAVRRLPTWDALPALNVWGSNSQQAETLERFDMWNSYRTLTVDLEFTGIQDARTLLYELNAFEGRLWTLAYAQMPSERRQNVHHSERIEAGRDDQWCALHTAFRAHVDACRRVLAPWLANYVDDAGFTQSMLQVAHEHPPAFWDTLWELVFDHLDTDAPHLPISPVELSFISLLVDRIMAQVFATQADECHRSLNKALGQMKDTAVMAREGARRALLLCGFVPMPHRSALGAATRTDMGR